MWSLHSASRTSASFLAGSIRSITSVFPIGGGNHNPDLEYVALRWMYRKAMTCGLPIIEANITDAAVHPEAPIKPNPLCKASLFWRTVNPTDRVHYSVAQHAILAGEDCHVVPPDCAIETLDDEKNQIVAPADATD
jgi:hypothetical protein